MSEQLISGAASNIIGGGGGSVLTLGAWVIWGLVIGLIGYFSWNILKNKYEARIFERTGSGVKQVKDKFREVRDDANKSIITYKFSKNKDDFEGEIPRKSFIMMKSLFGYKEIVYFFRDNNNKLTLMEVNDFAAATNFKPVDSANQKWANLKTKQLIEDFTSITWWDKFGNTLMLGAIIVVVLVVMIVMVREMGAFTETTASSLNNVANSMRAVAESSQSQFIQPSGGGSN